MTSFRQIEANRRNARKSMGPTSEEGKQRSRCNAVRHGLTAETVIGALEDAEDYQAFFGNWTGAFARVATVSIDLPEGRHGAIYRCVEKTSIGVRCLRYG